MRPLKRPAIVGTGGILTPAAAVPPEVSTILGSATYIVTLACKTDNLPIRLSGPSRPTDLRPVGEGSIHLTEDRILSVIDTLEVSTMGPPRPQLRSAGKSPETGSYTTVRKPITRKSTFTDSTIRVITGPNTDIDMRYRPIKDT